jgi:hypothetical protein
LRYSEMGSASIRPTPPASSPRILCSGRAQGRRVRGPAGSFFDKRCGRPPRSQSRALVRGPDRDVSENPCAHDRRKASILHLERDRLRAGPLRWATWIRFDPSSSPSAILPKATAGPTRRYSGRGIRPIKLARLHHRKIAELGAARNLRHIGAGLVKIVDQITWTGHRNASEGRQGSGRGLGCCVSSRAWRGRARVRSVLRAGCCRSDRC